MNMNRLINMAVRMLMNRGISKGVDIASRRGKRPEDMTAEERQAAQNARGNMQGTRRSLNILRRFMR